MMTQTATIRQRNVINEGDQAEFYGPGFRHHFEREHENLHMMPKAQPLDSALQIQWNFGQSKVPQPVQAGDMVRALARSNQLYKEHFNQRHKVP